MAIMIGSGVLLWFRAISVLSISVSMFIIISDTMRCLLVLNKSPFYF